MLRWKGKKALLYLFLLLPIVLFSRPEIRYRYDGKRVGRKYYPGEYYYQKSLRLEVPFRMQKISPHFFSYNSSPSLSKVRVLLHRDEIADKDGYFLKGQEVVWLTYVRESLRQGAVEINTRKTIPPWSRSVSIWIYDYESQSDAAIYIRNSKGLKKYFVAHLNYKGWKNFIVPIDPAYTEKELVFEKIKFFNRKKRGGNDQYKMHVKFGNIEVFSTILARKRKLGPILSNIPATKLTVSTLAISPGVKRYRVRRGIFWEKDENLSLVVDVKEDSYIEIIGSHLKFRHLLFALQTPFLKPGSYRLTFRFPAELARFNEDWKRKGVRFLGLMVFPVDKKDARLQVKNLVFWPGIYKKSP